VFHRSSSSIFFFDVLHQHSSSNLHVICLNVFRSFFNSLLSSLYSAFVARRNSAFDAGKGVRSVDVPVISVGNVSMGGTGKSPFVILLANTLLRMGHRPAIVSRGYGRRSRGVVLVSNGKSIQCSVQEAGDELSMIALALPQCVVVAAEQRFLGATRVVREFPEVDVILLDDGFQHRSLARNADIVLVDRATLDAPLVVPAGVLREPLTNINRASLLVCTTGVQAEELRPFTKAPMLFVHTKYSGCVRLQSIDSTAVATEPAPPRAVLVTAIANAHRVRETCSHNGIEVAHHAEYRDHYFYTAEDVHAIIALCKEHSCTVAITTAKDAPKLHAWLPDFSANGIVLLVLRIETVCTRQEMLEEFLKGVLRNDSKIDSEID
jgi:tetraacyldisaccharide 4'-kinase